ncbi:DUF4232 domain-containing protein [Actinacidiphila paucisporea]|uniref:DUF4232 domain-containing protein n=1 Tax=Actinacidiphila paucisporea TaxID=310782 RepID=A0A1M7NFA3_9ACTN|nr:DUF4232 domain-containing protein [Actinacidiphila paucisporea]SHN02313.1 Protein of unknown function [Actinacidiphila paucisporea]
MRSTSLAAGAAVVLAVAVAGAVPAAASAPVGRAPRTPMCTTSQLTGALGGGDAGAGHLYRYLVLTNHSSTTCHLTGYPGVSLLDSAGRQIGPPADRQSSRYAAVVLKPGGSASDTIHTVNHQGTCLPPSAKVRIYPPGNTAAMVIPGTITNCYHTLTVTPMAAGRNGSDPVTAPAPTPTSTSAAGRQVPQVPSGAPDTGLAATGGGHSPAMTAGAAAGSALLGGLAVATAARRRRGARD